MGVVLYKGGNVADAEAVYRDAADRGFERAAFNLGVLLHQRVDTKGARQAFRRACAAADPDLVARAREALAMLHD